MSNFKTGGPWITRFAPSPTGILHLGNVRTAVLNYLLARQSGGKFLLRLEDTDQERSTFAAEAAILWSLSWLGINPAEPPRHQSLRLEKYRQAVAQLVQQNLAYPCFCTEDELEQERSAAAAQNLPPRYSGRCAHLSMAQREERIARGDAHTIRFRLPEREDICFKDLIKGEISVPVSAFGDFVLLRSSDWPSYNLAVVVDDVEMGVTLVLRGEDHLTNTARQILLYEAFGATTPSFAHHGLLVDPRGKKLSKRTGALSVPECIGEGLHPLAVVHYLASLAGALPTKSLFDSLDAMAAAFNPFALGRGNAVMNIDELRALSARYFRAIPAASLLQSMNQLLPETDPWQHMDDEIRIPLLEALRENASSSDDIRKLLPYFTQPEVPFSLAALNQLRKCLPVLKGLAIALAQTSAPYLDKSGMDGVLRNTAEHAQVKGKELYHPIRLALTGSDSGPELSALLRLLPVEWLRSRIQAPLELLDQ